MRSYTTTVDWTYDNMGDIGISSQLVNVPYELFAHTVVVEDPLNDSLQMYDGESLSTSSKSKERISYSSEHAVGTSMLKDEQLFVNETRKDISVSNPVREELILIDNEAAEVKVDRHVYLQFYESEAIINNGEEESQTSAEREPITILSDLEFSYLPQGQTEFEEYCNRKSPLGYSKLRPLYAGDYEYKDAIVGVQVTLTPPVEGRYGISGAKLHIDVEDVVDKGTVFCDGNGETTVGFNKRFYTKPKIFTAISNASAVCSAVIKEVNTRGPDLGYFKVELRAVTDDSLCSGTLNWLAEGY